MKKLYAIKFTSARSGCMYIMSDDRKVLEEMQDDIAKRYEMYQDEPTEEALQDLSFWLYENDLYLADDSENPFCDLDKEIVIISEK